MKKTLTIIGKILICFVAAILALVLLIFGGLNAAKYLIYSEYYSITSNLCLNPGLNDGFVCQGICAVESEEVILVSGYMKDDSPSRVYITDLESNSTHVTLTSEGKKFTGHAGGIAVNGDYVYLADDEKIYVFDLDTLIKADNGSSIEIGKGIAVNNAASFAYASDDYLYVGEFHDGKNYFTDHPYETSDGTYYAIVSRYSYDDLTKPNKIYSIRNKVQGICFTPDGKVVMSTSYGVADSVYYVYNESDAVDSGLTLDGAPLFYLDKCIKEVKGPAMAEGLDYYDGKIITLTESASDKYIFGKFFYADKIVALDI